MKKVFLITGSAGFIGSHLAKFLLQKKFTVYGVDNLNNYYSKKLKLDRNAELLKYKNYKFIKLNIINKKKLQDVFKKKITHVIHLAAQAGVRYSITNPDIYIDTNIKGFFNVLDLCKINKIKHFIFASSSSVYGLNNKQPFSEYHTTDHPISLYGATKKSNELIAHSYSYLFNIRTTGLRFFTVYGPGGRPDMSLFLFVKAILKNKSLNVFNYGNMRRSFTYIDDIIHSIEKIIFHKIKKKNFFKKYSANFPLGTSSAPFEIFNLGNPKDIDLKKYISLIEKEAKKKSIKSYLKMQLGDVKSTKADMKKFYKYYKEFESTNIGSGIKRFVSWYKNYNNI